MGCKGTELSQEIFHPTITLGVKLEIIILPQNEILVHIVILKVG